MRPGRNHGEHGMFRLVEFTLTHSVMTSFIHVRFDGAYTERQKERNQFLGSHSPKLTASKLMGLVTLGEKKGDLARIFARILLEFIPELPEFVTLAFRGRGRSVWRTVTPSPPPPSPRHTPMIVYIMLFGINNCEEKTGKKSSSSSRLLEQPMGEDGARGGGGYFHMYAYWVCAARETPIFSPEFPFRSI